MTIIATVTATAGKVIVCKGRKTRARWDSEVESKLIDIWVDIL